jgi:hypothetical protein
LVSAGRRVLLDQTGGRAASLHNGVTVSKVPPVVFSCSHRLPDRNRTLMSIIEANDSVSPNSAGHFTEYRLIGLGCLSEVP